MLLFDFLKLHVLPFVFGEYLLAFGAYFWLFGLRGMVVGGAVGRSAHAVPQPEDAADNASDDAEPDDEDGKYDDKQES